MYTINVTVSSMLEKQMRMRTVKGNAGLEVQDVPATSAPLPCCDLPRLQLQ